MLLEAQKEICKECKECKANCIKLVDPRILLRCKHCKDPPCVKACHRNAFVEIAEGVYAIDETRCNGCGKCAEACPENAIILRNGKAVKCDLCAELDFKFMCMASCPKGAIKIVQSKESISEVAKNLGWYIRTDYEIGKVIREWKTHKLIESKEGKKAFYITKIPSITSQESHFLKNFLEFFKNIKSKNLSAALEFYCRKNRVVLNNAQKEYFLEILECLTKSYGPLSFLLEEDIIEEIAIIGINKPVYVYDKNHGWLETNLYYADEQVVKDLINKMGRTIGRRIALQNPQLNAMLKDGSRLNAVIQPIAISGPSVTIRKFRSKPFMPADLLKFNTLSAEALAFLWFCMQTESSLLIAGNTGSGKTTTLNALFYFVPRQERIIITEETPEINLPHEHQVRLCTSQGLNINMSDLIVNTLRMRPDRIIVGEIRNEEEVKAFIDTLLAGQGKGSYATFHALSANEAIKRIRNLGIMEQDINALDLIIVQKRWTKIDLKNNQRKEIRRIVEISEVVENDGKVGINKIFSYNYEKDFLERVGDSIKVKHKVKNAFSFSEKAYRKALLQKKKELEQIANKESGK
ncbi:MAG: hypothetical protein DRO04_00915 [Candidatus Iainarchaeum archaeon]|uniref:4Fe-4S ferredoxin-type domain-containing protein n=1 Tax=Candidatus Iainarchaeum sp. TaxID=3101447 RepID=A0A497JJ85_9ARCH|nr:MAG: hypothetical protein DRO04_00915 [Candidatus Diapherotrites archaeon]